MKTRTITLWIILGILSTSFGAMLHYWTELREESRRMLSEIDRYKRPSAAGRYLAGVYAERTNNPTIASDYFESTLANQPDNKHLMRKTYTALILAGNVHQAVVLARERAIHYDESQSLTLLLQSIAALNAGDFEQIIPILDDYLTNSVAHTNQVNTILLPAILASAHIGLQQYDAALAALDRIPRQYLGSFLDYQRALIHELAGNTQKAAEFYDGLDTKALPYRLANAAARYYTRQGELEKAESINAANAQTQQQFSQDQFLQHDFISDLTPHKRATTIATEVFVEIAALVNASRQLENAIFYFQTALYLSPDYYFARLLLAGLYERYGQYAIANQLYAQVDGDDEAMRKLRMAAAMNYHHMNNTEQAKAMLLQIAEDFPASPDALVRLGDLTMQDKDFDGAIDHYTNAIARFEEEDKNHWAVYYARGAAYEQAGEWDAAEADFLHALDLFPGQPEVLNYLAYSWLIQGKHIQEAEDMLKRAIDASPKAAHIIDSYGWALYNLGRYDEAVRYLETANLLLPHDPTINDHLGDTYWQIGRITEARFQWERALTFEPEKEGEVESIRAKLRYGIDGQPSDASSSAAAHVNDSTTAQ